MDQYRKNLLNELETTRDKFWNIGRDTAEFLHNLVLLRKFKKVLEIGTSNGYSGIVLGNALEKNNGKLITIESHAERFKMAEENFSKAKLEKTIIQIKGHAPEDIPADLNNLDLVFLDATKKEHLNYFNTLKDRLTPHGIIIGDNVQSHREKMKNYIEEVKHNSNFTTVELSLGTGLLVSYLN